MISHFSILPENQDVRAIEIAGGGLHARILTWGASLQDLRLDGHAPPLVLGFPRLEDYLAHAAHHGAIAGPVINRIAGGMATIDGTHHSFDRNDHDRQTLHGGAGGFGWQNWQVAATGASFVELAISQPDGHMGFPGRIDAKCRYELSGDGMLSVALLATTQKPTLLNMGHHSYFTLDDRGDIRDHTLRIDAERVLLADETDLATGESLDVRGTGYDFTRARSVSDPFDNNFCLAQQRRAPQTVAQLASPHSRVTMDVITSEPGLQLYTGHKLNAAVAGLNGRIDKPFAGLCLEPQMWPNAPDNPSFPSIVLRPGERSQQVSCFKFTNT